MKFKIQTKDKISQLNTNESLIEVPSQVECDAFIVDHESAKMWGEPSSYDLIVTDVTAQEFINERINALVVSGSCDELTCKKCLNLIGGMNKERNLATAQIQDMASTFASIDFCLDKSMPKSAKALIDAMVPDEVIVTSELKSLLLEILKGY